MESTVSLQIVDYLVIALTLFISLGIGVLFAVKDFKNVNRTEYLLGGRRMSMLPVAFSIFATFTSGIALVGMVTEIYLAGLMAGTIYVGLGLSYVVAAVTIVPLLYPLRLTSLYEYLQLRFHSSTLRIFVVILGMLQTLSYMAIVLLSPALALQAGANLPMWVSVGIVGAIGTVYTAIGGIKSVVWTDVFQGLVMLGGVFTIIIKGSITVGGGAEVWRMARAGGRTDFTNFSMDPRVLDTWWGSTIGGTIFWYYRTHYRLGTICSQSSSQRISAMKSITEAKNAFFLNGALIIVFGSLLVALAWVMYAYFVYIGCDPFQDTAVNISIFQLIVDFLARLLSSLPLLSERPAHISRLLDIAFPFILYGYAGIISNPNQLPPYFVMHALTDMPGMGGLYLAMVFSGSLSTLSSGISSLAANTVEDLLKTPLKSIEETTVTFITKVLVFGYGVLTIGLAYWASSLKGPLTNIVNSCLGASGGPILGIFLLGALVPWSNKYGAIGGGVISILFNVWLAVGNQMYASIMYSLPPPKSDKCHLNSSMMDVTVANVSATYFHYETLYSNPANQTSVRQAQQLHWYGFSFYDISFEWYGLIGVAVCLMFGMAISYCARRRCMKVTNANLLFPFVRRVCLSKLSNGSYNAEGNCKLILYTPDLQDTVSPQMCHVTNVDNNRNVNNVKKNAIV